MTALADESLIVEGEQVINVPTGTATQLVAGWRGRKSAHSHRSRRM